MLVKVAEASEIEDGKGKVVRAGEGKIAVFRVGEEYFALDNVCLHRGGPLGEGELDGEKLICPWHGWTYDIRTGSFVIIPALKVRKYETVLKGNEVFVELGGNAK